MKNPDIYKEILRQIITEELNLQIDSAGENYFQDILKTLAMDKISENINLLNFEEIYKQMCNSKIRELSKKLEKSMNDSKLNERFLCEKIESTNIYYNNMLTAFRLQHLELLNEVHGEIDKLKDLQKTKKRKLK